MDAPVRGCPAEAERRRSLVEVDGLSRGRLHPGGTGSSCSQQCKYRGAAVGYPDPKRRAGTPESSLRKVHAVSRSGLPEVRVASRSVGLRFVAALLSQVWERSAGGLVSPDPNDEKPCA